MLWKVAFVSFHWQITWIYTPPHRITNHHRDVVRFLGVGNPKLNLKKKTTRMVDPTNHGWFSEIFFRLTFRNISHIPLKIAAWKRRFFLCNLANGAFLRVHPSFFLGGVPGPARFFWEPRLIARPKRSLGKAKAVFSNHISGGEIAVVNRCNFPGEFSIHDFWFLFLFKKTNTKKKAGKQKKHGWNFCAMGKKCWTLIWWVCGIPPNKWGLMNNSYLHLKFYFFAPEKWPKPNFGKSGGKLVFRPSAFPWVNIAVKLWGCMGFSVWGWSTMNVSEWL